MRGVELLQWRKRLGLTQAEAGEKLGVTRATILNWETEATPIPRVVETGCQIWEKKLKKRPDFGPVTLIYSDEPMFVNPYGPARLAMMQRELYPTNGIGAGLRSVGKSRFSQPFDYGGIRRYRVECG